MDAIKEGFPVRESFFSCAKFAYTDTSELILRDGSAD